MPGGQKLKIRFDEPEHGWIALTIGAGEEPFHVVATYVPFDCISEMAVALNQLLSNEPRATVRMGDGPIEYEMSFNVRDNQIKVEISIVTRAWGGTERQFLFGFTEEYGQTLIAFWRALRELQGRYEPAEYQRRWHQPFPTRELEVLTERITTLKNGQHSR